MMVDNQFAVREGSGYRKRRLSVKDFKYLLTSRVHIGKFCNLQAFCYEVSVSRSKYVMVTSNGSPSSMYFGRTF